MRLPIPILPRLICCVALAAASLPLIGCGGPGGGVVAPDDEEAQLQMEREQEEAMEAGEEM